MPTPTIYQPLADYLAAQPPAVTRVRLALSEIEMLVGHPLPATASSAGWWSNSDREPRSRIWRAVGWRVAAAVTRVPHPVVTFARVGLADTPAQPSA